QRWGTDGVPKEERMNRTAGTLVLLAMLGGCSSMHQAPPREGPFSGSTPLLAKAPASTNKKIAPHAQTESTTASRQDASPKSLPDVVDPTPSVAVPKPYKATQRMGKSYPNLETPAPQTAYAHPHMITRQDSMAAAGGPPSSSRLQSI